MGRWQGAHHRKMMFPQSIRSLLKEGYIMSNIEINVALAQLNRASGYGPEG